MDILTQICDDVNFIKGKEEGREEGKEEGKEKGKVEGRKEERIEIVKAMLKENFSIEQISRITHLPSEWITKNIKI